jgi:hypothetical protein
LTPLVKTKKALLFRRAFVPVTDQFSNYFYQNIEEIYALKEILIGEGIDLNTSLRHSNTGMQANSVLPLWN